MRHVLIIDDHPGVGKVLALRRSLHDICAAVATRPAEGLARLERQAAAPGGALTPGVRGSSGAWSLTDASGRSRNELRNGGA